MIFPFSFWKQGGAPALTTNLRISLDAASLSGTHGDASETLPDDDVTDSEANDCLIRWSLDGNPLSTATTAGGAITSSVPEAYLLAGPVTMAGTVPLEFAAFTTFYIDPLPMFYTEGRFSVWTITLFGQIVLIGRLTTTEASGTIFTVEVYIPVGEDYWIGLPTPDYATTGTTLSLETSYDLGVRVVDNGTDFDVIKTVDGVDGSSVNVPVPLPGIQRVVPYHMDEDANTGESGPSILVRYYGFELLTS